MQYFMIVKSDLFVYIMLLPMYNFTVGLSVI